MYFLAGDDMSKLTLLIFLALLPIAFADFDRPWENQGWISSNPAIFSYGIEVWWNLPLLHKPLDSFDYSQINNLNISDSARSKLNQSIISKNQANSNLQVCQAADNLKSLWYSSAIVIPVSTLIPITIEFMKISNCMSYKNNWINSVDSSLGLIEQGIDESESALDNARIHYNEIEFMGLCDENYTNTGSVQCLEIKSIFHTLDSNITEGNYGQYPLLLSYSKDLEAELRKPFPDLSILGSMAKLIWGEKSILALLEQVSLKANYAKTISESEFNSIIESAKGRKQLVTNEITKLKAQDLELISSAPSSFEVHGIGTIEDMFAEICEYDDDSAILLREAELERNRIFKRSYMANAISMASRADYYYENLLSNIDDLEQYSLDTLNQQEEEAAYELSETEKFLNSTGQSTTGVDLYNQAIDLYNSAESQSTTGKKFVAYSKAAAYARAARNQQDQSKELNLNSLLQQLEDLIERAKTDEINIVTETETLVLLDNLNPYQQEEIIRASIANILLKARVKYNDDLLETQTRIYDKLSLAEPFASDLYTDMERYEEGIFQADEINYPLAIGHLKELKENYVLIETTLDQYMSEIVGNSMSASTSPLIDAIYLDQPSNITLDMVLINDRNYGAENVPVKISFDRSLSFLYSDICFGREDVKSIHMEDAGKTLVIVFAKVDPFEAKRITMEKQATIAHTTGRKAESIGIGNDAAHISEVIDFQLDMNIPRLSFENGFQDTFIDGINPSRSLNAGKHQITSEKTIQDAYNEKIININSYRMGTNSKVEYTIEINLGCCTTQT